MKRGPRAPFPFSSCRLLRCGPYHAQPAPARRGLQARRGATGGLELTADRLSAWVGWLLLALVIALFSGLLASPSFTSYDKKRILVIFLLFFGASVFWGCFEQAGSTMSLFAEGRTHNVIFGDARLSGLAFDSSAWQSVNSVFVIIMAPVFAWLWLSLARRQKDLSSPTKFGVAMVLVAASFLWLFLPALQIVAQPVLQVAKDSLLYPAIDGAGIDPLELKTRVSPIWLLGLYFIQTCAELCLSPVGLSSMTRLAPAALGGMVMGIWFLGSACGNYMAGFVASKYDAFPLDKIFLLVAAAPAVAALIFFVLTGPIKRMLASAAPAGGAAP